jgi:hypothetical protein
LNPCHEIISLLGMVRHSADLLTPDRNLSIAPLFSQTSFLALSTNLRRAVLLFLSSYIAETASGDLRGEQWVPPLTLGPDSLADAAPMGFAAGSQT